MTSGAEPQPVAGAHDDVADGPAQPQQHVAQPGAAALDVLVGPQRLADLVDRDRAAVGDDDADEALRVARRHRQLVARRRARRSARPSP